MALEVLPNQSVTTCELLNRRDTAVQTVANVQDCHVGMMPTHEREAVGRDLKGHVVLLIKGRPELLQVSQPYSHLFRQM